VRVFPYPITAESRRRKLQRFLDLLQLMIANLVPINYLVVIGDKLRLKASCQGDFRR
jgi:hypothetical protein